MKQPAVFKFPLKKFFEGIQTYPTPNKFLDTSARKEIGIQGIIEDNKNPRNAIKKKEEEEVTNNKVISEVELKDSELCAARKESHQAKKAIDKEHGDNKVLTLAIDNLNRELSKQKCELQSAAKEIKAAEKKMHNL